MKLFKLGLAAQALAWSVDVRDFLPDSVSISAKPVFKMMIRKLKDIFKSYLPLFMVDF